MQPLVEPVARLVEALARLPGIGPKTAQRLAFFLLRMPPETARELAQAILRVKEAVVYCSACLSITDRDPCAICSDPNRDPSLVCAVEEPLDLYAIERTGAYQGLYHVLHGALSPIEGVGPDELKLQELLKRLKSGTVKELILATNANVEGEATAMYIERLVKPLGIAVSRLARGLPVGSDLEYADAITLARALEGRRFL
jgi:recombination protein RecR